MRAGILAVFTIGIVIIISGCTSNTVTSANPPSSSGGTTYTVPPANGTSQPTANLVKACGVIKQEYIDGLNANSNYLSTTLQAKSVFDCISSNINICNPDSNVIFQQTETNNKILNVVGKRGNICLLNYDTGVGRGVNCSYTAEQLGNMYNSLKASGRDWSLGYGLAFAMGTTSLTNKLNTNIYQNVKNPTTNQTEKVPCVVYSIGGEATPSNPATPSVSTNNTPTCIDSDGGIDPNVYGRLNMGNQISLDFCLVASKSNSVYITDGNCQTSGYPLSMCYVSEKFCNSTGEFDVKQIPCPNGCNNGACL